MKVILPYREHELIGEQGVQLLDRLGVEDHQILDQILLHWTTYTFGRVDEVYDLTVDELSALLEERQRFGKENNDAWELLRTETDAIVEIHAQIAQHLQDCLQQFPDEWVRQFADEEDAYHFVRVELVDTIGSRLILTTDAIDT